MQYGKGLFVLLTMLILNLGFLGCRTRGPIEQAGDTIGTAVKDTGRVAGNAVKGTGEVAGDVVKGAGESVENLAN